MATARKLSITDINQMNKDTLKQHLKEFIKRKDETADFDGVFTMLQTILDEVREGNAQRQALEAEMQQLKQANAKLVETVASQQRFLEYLDDERRGQYLVITGVSESTPLNDTTTTAATDNEKVPLI